MKTKNPVSENCPQRDSSSFRRVKSEVQIAFTDDRVCTECGTRYTPPTPLWARILFGAVGICILVGGVTMAILFITGDNPRPKGFVAYLILALFLGGGCIYKGLAPD
jgi:hypothetical protein